MGWSLLQGRCVPDADVFPAGRDDLVAVRAEGDAVDPAGVPAEGQDLLAGLGVPELEALVRAGAGDEAAAVGAEGHPPGRPGVAFQEAHLLAGRHAVK